MYDNSPCSVMAKLTYTVLVYSMVLHLPYASTCYDKLVIYHTQQLQRLTYHNLPYHTWTMTSNYTTWYLTATQTVWALFGVLWLGLSAVARMLQLNHSHVDTSIIFLTWPLLNRLNFHKRNSSSYRVQGVPRIIGIYTQIPLQAFYSVLPRIIVIAVWIYFPFRLK